MLYVFLICSLHVINTWSTYIFPDVINLMTNAKLMKFSLCLRNYQAIRLMTEKELQAVQIDGGGLPDAPIPGQNSRYSP